eukprot:CAMPEP_0185190278 /NCGR_PEP_ID=MMETSP1140-20130426/7407_1 /TAXON_ID=298111 /ORGANISM="Pavlova sp., Strain CCMP459" /LENGTH=85 /DNA_ID=CAMNT_0027756893 /DNA_START=715 /DNA_END=968 /DNA_ORIENTATION=+
MTETLGGEGTQESLALISRASEASPLPPVAHHLNGGASGHRGRGSACCGLVRGEEAAARGRVAERALEADEGKEEEARPHYGSPT